MSDKNNIDTVQVWIAPNNKHTRLYLIFNAEHTG